MKKILAIISLLFSFIPSQGQSYIPIPIDSTAWLIQWGCNAGGTCTCSYYYQFMSNGDTVINSTTYQKIIKVGVSGNCPCPCPQDPFGYRGAIRQDTLGEKVFIIQPDSSTEEILYDFTQNIGDTLNTILSPDGCGPEIIGGIDSIIIGTVYHKRLNIIGTGCNPLGVNIIEGVGSDKGLVEPFMGFEYGGTLICASNNGHPIYPDLTTPCPVVTSIASEKKEYNISIKPNPFKEYFEIDLSKPFNNIELTLYDILARKLLVIKKDQVETLRVQRDNMNPGLYFYQLKSNDKIISAGKIIAE